MADLIDRQAAIEAVSTMFAPTPTQKDMVEDCLEIIENQPTVDAVEVVRCKDCRWYAGEGMHCANNIVVQFDHFFCYYGERREDDGSD